MNEITGINLRSLESGLSPFSAAVFRALYANARKIITRKGQLEFYEKPLAQLLKETGCGEVETVAGSIREILQRMIECKKGEFLVFLPLLKSISIEKGVVRYSLPREIEGHIMAHGRRKAAKS